MSDYQRIDPTIYGAQPLTARDNTANADSPLYAAPAAVPASAVVAGSTLLAEGEAARREAQRQEATAFESVGASMSQWLPAQMYREFHAPTFAADATFNPADFVRRSVDFTLTVPDEQFIMKAKSAEDAEHRTQVIRDRNTAYTAMGDSPVASFLTGALDPTYLAIDMASMGAARVLRLGKLGAGGISAGLTVGSGVYESTLTPTTPEQIAINAMAMGAASAMTFRNGRVVRSDEGFPAQELGDVARRAERPQVAGEVQAMPDPSLAEMPSNLTTARVPATGEGRTPLTYRDGTSAPEYNPNWAINRETQAALTSDGRAVMVNSVDDIAAHSEAVARGHVSIEPDAKAVYLPSDDRVYLVGSNIKAGDDVKGILLHEYGVHMNAERVLGTKTMGEMLDRLEDLAVSGNQRAKRAFEEVPSNTPQHLVREEALGYYVERNHAVFGDGIVQRFTNGVRAALRKVGLGGLKLSEGEIVALVRKAAKGGAKAEKVSFDATFPMAWHGSPVKGIDSLQTRFAGTGEGQQAFGWGHYLTSEKGTALDYRNKEAVRRGKAADDGGLYRVKIKATEDQFLDLDARVQSPTVAAALASLGVREGVTGKSAYEFLAKSLGGAKQASEALHAAGVAGNRYATGRTRHAAVKSSNYVLFSDSTVDIAARYSRGSASVTKAQATKQALSAKGVAQAIEWSWHKTMRGYSPKSAEIADLLMDNPVNMTGNSAASMQRAIRADLASFQYKYEGLLLDAMSSRGFGVLKRITNTREAVRAQQAIETDVYRELLRRNRAARDGVSLSSVGVSPEVAAMADSLDALARRALQEMKAAGVAGADEVDELAGYINRRWDIAKIEAIEAKLLAAGPMDPAALRMRFVDTISIGIQRANGWDAQVAQDIAGAIYDRTKRKGQFQDAEFHANLGEDSANVLRSMLSAEGLGGQRLERVMEILAGKADDAGKTPTLKSRVDMHMDEAMLLPDGSSASIMDMLDTNVSLLTERYLDTASARSALAKKGIESPTAVANMRKELAQSIPDLKARGEAVQGFDDAMNVLHGHPVGEDMLSGMRNVQAVTQMVGLASSGMWQLTEYATIMARFGAGRVMSSMLKEMPFLRKLSPQDSASLHSVLTRNSAQDTRLRPFITRMEDGFDVPASDSVQLSLMQAKQLVPYANAMKYVQHHQARTTANLIIDVLNRAAGGESSALKTLAEYGLESHSMVKVSPDIRTHGMDTSKWSHATWQEVRGPLTKMMDDAVLRARLGEMPKFAHTSQVGKFLFTFRSFVLAAHNKVLANTLNNSGYAGLGLLLAYQMPLTVLATAANSGLAGKKQESLEETTKKAFSQLGALGLFSEMFGVMAGTKQQFGAPGLIAVDRLYKALGSIHEGNPGNTAAAMVNATPILSAILPARALGEALKDNKE